MKDKIKVLHVPEICQYNEFISRTSNIQKNANLEILKPNICIDGKQNGSNDLEEILTYNLLENEKMVVHFHWPEKLYKKIDYKTFENTIINLKNKNVKLVKTIHNLVPHEMEEEDKKKEEFLFKNLDGVVLFSQSQLETFQKMYKFSGKIVVIPHPNYQVSETKINKSKKQYVLCIPGRIRKYKQTDIILKTLQLLEEYEVKVIIVGKPDDLESVEHLKKCSNNNLLCDFSFVTTEQLEKYISQSDMVLLTHKYIWTSGIAILSANLGTTLLGTLPKIFEEYDSNEIGYFLESGENMTPEKMAQLIKNAINDGKDNIYKKGKKLKKIIDKNDDKLIGELYIQFYEELFD